jgi:hypothetical protein
LQVINKPVACVIKSQAQLTKENNHLSAQLRLLQAQLAAVVV